VGETSSEQLAASTVSYHLSVLEQDGAWARGTRQPCSISQPAGPGRGDRREDLIRERICGVAVAAAQGHPGLLLRASRAELEPDQDAYGQQQPRGEQGVYSEADDGQGLLFASGARIR
jgi:DNA-binding transcriptional ArsR family regulator